MEAFLAKGSFEKVPVLRPFMGLRDVQGLGSRVFRFGAKSCGLHFG